MYGSSPQPLHLPGAGFPSLTDTTQIQYQHTHTHTQQNTHTHTHTHSHTHAHTQTHTHRLTGAERENRLMDHLSFFPSMDVVAEGNVCVACGPVSVCISCVCVGCDV